MRRVLLVSLFVVSAAVCTQTATSLPFGPTTMGPICDASKMNDGKPFQRIEVLVRKDGSINWNGTTVTKERFEAYAKDAAGYREVFAFIEGENQSPALQAKVRDLRTDAMTLGVTVAQCSPIRGPDGHIL
jgi:hypothetical protein